MSKEIQTIGVLTSGGDAPGMNAAIRAVVREAIARRIRARRRRGTRCPSLRRSHTRNASRAAQGRYRPCL